MFEWKLKTEKKEKRSISTLTTIIYQEWQYRWELFLKLYHIAETFGTQVAPSRKIIREDQNQSIPQNIPEDPEN